MTTQTTAFTAEGAGAAFSLQPGQSATYSSSGVFTGYVRFQISRTQGATWETVQDAAVDTNLAGGTWKNESNAEQRFRFQAFDTDALTAWTGTCTTVLTDVNDTVRYLKDDNGKVYGYVTDDGVVFIGDVTVGDALTVTGDSTTKVGVEDSLTAHAGGTQAAALALSATAFFHRISVCATAGDSVILPAATVGKSHYIRNDGAASAQVYAALTETINGVASATGVPLGAGSGVLYFCTTAGKWTTAAGDELDGRWQVNASGAFLPNVDGQYDIGNGASDPRDINLTRHVYSADVITSSTPGTPAALVTAVEYGDSRVRTTVLTLAAFAVGLSGDNANLARGATLYTFPAGEIIVESASINVGLTLADAIQTDTPEIGLGTVAAAGEVQATLGAVGATAEDIMEGVAVADVAGTAKVNTDIPTANVPLVIATGAAHTVCLNVADGWADLTAPAAITATGTVVINWRFMS